MVRHPDKYSNKQIDNDPQQPAADNVEYKMAAERYASKTHGKDEDADGADDSRFKSVVDGDEGGGQGKKRGAPARKAGAFEYVCAIGGVVAPRSITRFLSIDGIAQNQHNDGRQ